MSEKDGDKHVFSYMDGIPVKISEKYKPPRKIVLPFGFQNRILQPPVSPDYDFQLEHDVLLKLEQWRSLRAKEKEIRKQRIAEEDAERQKMLDTMQELQKTMNELSTDEDSAPRQSTSESPSPIPVSIPVQAHSNVQPAQPALSVQTSVCPPVISEENPILRPIPIKHQVVVSSQINNNKPLCAFNLSDFEADTSSPFDNMELKTINDLEELAQVLQPSSINQMPGFYQNPIPLEEGFGSVHQTAMDSQAFNHSSSNKMSSESKCDVNYHAHVNGFTPNYGYNNLQSYSQQTVIPNVNPHGQAVAYNFGDSKNMTPLNEALYAYSHHDTRLHHPSYYSTNVWPSVSYQPPHESHFGTMVINNDARKALACTTSLASSLDRSEERSPEDDAEPVISSVAQQLSDLMKSRTFKHHAKPSQESTPETSSSVQSPTTPSESDPFESLPTESQLLVRKIAEMGFPRPRVARACQNIGTNDKKIIEFLLSLQSFLDAGYQEERAERALSLLNQDVNDAGKYLQVESQLLDLGFPAERVSEALVKFNCDRDQALEFLIS